MQQLESMIGQLDTAIFAKDLSHRYIYCNEKFAHACDQDSPAACYGKSDADMIWKEYSSIYLKSDESAYRGESLCNVLEPLRDAHHDAITILVNKHPLLNRVGKMIGVVGSYVDVTNLNIASQISSITPVSSKGFDLGDYFDHTSLTEREFQVFKKILMGQTAKQIAFTLSISPKTIETHIARIKIKMQCNSCGEIISQAVISGLYQRLLNVLSS